MLIFNLYFLSSLANPRKTSTSRIFAYYTKTRRLDAASFSSSLNCLVYGFKSIPCLSFGSRNGDSIAKSYRFEVPQGICVGLKIVNDG